MGRGLVRCVACGDVQWNLRGDSAGQSCRVCGAELRSERRRPGRRFAKLPKVDRRDARPGAPS
jgi:hypothetical protein